MHRKTDLGSYGPLNMRVGAPEIAGLLLIVLAATAVKLSLFPLTNSDLTAYVGPWLQHIRGKGFAALGDTFTDYAPGYTYFLWLGAVVAGGLADVALIKTISVTADLAMAVAGGLVAWRASGDPMRGGMAAAVLVALPTVVLNSGAWGQSDAVWTAFMLLAVLCLLQERFAVACLLWGGALALKPQAIFLAPVMCGVLLSRRAWWSVLLVPLPYILLAVPTILMGRRWTSVFGVYVFSAVYPRELSSSAPNIWSWLPPDAGIASVLGAVALGGLVGLVILAGNWRLDRKDREGLMLAAALSCTVLPFVLPKMHDRYFYGGEILVALLVCLRPSLLPALVAGQAAALLAYEPMLLGLSGWRVPVGAGFNLIAVAVLARAWLGAVSITFNAGGAAGARAGEAWRDGSYGVPRARDGDR